MKIDVIAGNLLDQDVDTLIYGIFEGADVSAAGPGALDRALDGALSALISGGDFKGKAGETAALYPLGKLKAKRVVLVGLGVAEALDLEGVRRGAGAGIKRARDLGASRVATSLPEAESLDPEKAAQALVEGALLALYRYDAPRQKPDERNEIESLTLVETDSGHLDADRRGAQAAEVIADAVYLARDLVNMPPNAATPTHLAQVAQEIAGEFGLKAFIGEREWALEQGMGAFTGVARGTHEPPKFIVLEHNADRSDLETIVLVGKGITFDSGGVSLKPAEKMGDMKDDMAGAAAVLSAMKAVARLDLPLRVIAITPCTDNMQGGSAYHPGDVLTASNGKTIEIISTDAEGRLVLADALVFAARYQPRAVIDLATLTGACVIALGAMVAAGMFASDDDLRDRLLRSADNTFERVWPLPLYDDYHKSIKSDVADIKNSGGRMGGVGTSATFLKEFTDYPWVHLDIAGMPLATAEGPYTPAGGTGYGVRLLVDLLRNW